MIEACGLLSTAMKEAELSDQTYDRQRNIASLHCMTIERRDFLAGAAAVMSVAAPVQAGEKGTMHGLVGKLKARAGKRDALAGILLDGVSGMPGCLSYVVANDPTDPDVL